MITLRSFLRKALIGTLLLFSACDELQPQANEQRPRPSAKAQDCSDLQSKTEVRNLVAILVDRTDSFWSKRNQDAIRNEAPNVARQLPEATLILGRFISEDSWSDSEMFLQDVVPQLPPPIECANPFDEKCLKEKRHRKSLAGCLEEARHRVADKLLRFSPQKRSLKTDIFGGIAAISELMAAYPKNLRKVVILISDLVDNVGIPLPPKLPGFEGSKVLVMTANTKGPQRVAELKAIFTQRFSGWGAARVVFRPLGLPLRAGEILDPQVEGP